MTSYSFPSVREMLLPVNSGPPGKLVKQATLIGSYAPRQCGIATFTQDLRNALIMARPALEAPVAMMMKEYAGSPPTEVRHLVSEQTRAAYGALRAALNGSGTEIVSLQHEYGIFGGPDGAWILDALRGLRMPLVTTCHTVLAHPTAGQRQVLGEIGRLSAGLVVMTEHAKDLLVDNYGVPSSKITLIPHGIPDADPAEIDAAVVRCELDWSGRDVLLTTGLLSPNKGIQHVIAALPRIVAVHPETLYVVAGATHPDLLRREGEAYRESLHALAADLGVSENVRFINRFAAREELVRMIAAADLFVTPYLNEAQITSGVLAYASGLGKPVISTPYWHAKELLTEERGILVPFADPDAIAAAAIALFSNRERLAEMASAARAYGRQVTWRNTGQRYLECFDEVCKSTRFPGRSRSEEHVGLAHLSRLMGPLGIYQHAKLSEPDLAHGYCTDDNARALITAQDLLRTGHPDPILTQVKEQTFEFVREAFEENIGRFRNFRGVDGQWLDSPGSEDSHGRALWALGHIVHHATELPMRVEAVKLFQRALPAVFRFTSPRAWAFTILGLAGLNLVTVNHRQFGDAQVRLATRLMRLHRRASDDQWQWFEPGLSYDNARLPQALLVTAAQTGQRGMRAVGLYALRWLMQWQQAPEQHFRAIGSDGFFHRGAPAPARWDQQPLEALATLVSCFEAHRHHETQGWDELAQRAFAWFEGANDLGMPVGNYATGACFDGLQADGLNQNCGAESTLAFLHSCAEMRLRHLAQMAVPRSPLMLRSPMAVFPQAH